MAGRDRVAEPGLQSLRRARAAIAARLDLRPREIDTLEVDMSVLQAPVGSAEVYLDRARHH